jgi:hypothetical protein
MRGKKRSGGRLRKEITGQGSVHYEIRDPRTVPSAITLWGEGIRETDRELVEINFGLWGIGYLEAEFKNFLFNLVQGKLYLNNVLARIGNENPGCTFCVIWAKKELEERGIVQDRPEYDYYLRLVEVETVGHLFWDCEHSNKVIQQAYRWMYGYDWYRGIEQVNRDEFFIGILNDRRKLTRLDIIWKHFTKFFLYACILKRRLPHFPTLKYELEGVLSMINRRNVMGLEVNLRELL